MNQLLTSFLDAINAERNLLEHLAELNRNLRLALIERDQTSVASYIAQLKSSYSRITEADTEREKIWHEIQETFSLVGNSFYAKLQSLPREYDAQKLEITESYQALKVSYWNLKNSTASLEVYTDTALDITETLLDGVRFSQNDTYSSRGEREMRESDETRALIINEEL